MASMGLSEEQERAQRRRNVVIALTLAGFALLFFVITIVRMGHHGP